MGERALQNRIMKLKEIEERKKALEAEAEKIRGELKACMEEKQVEELKAGPFTIRWKNVIVNRLDGKALKEALPEIYGKFCRTSEAWRFTIA